jgi:hypothetical protein
MTINRSNLARLAAYLESLPLTYADFDMDDFIDPWEEADPQLKVKYALENGGVGAVCGTVACAVGHGPSAGMLFQKDEIISAEGDEGEPRPDWWAYGRRVFGLTSGNPEFLWLFGAMWSDRDNTHRGAAARIRYYLDRGLPECMAENPYHSLLPDEAVPDLYKEYLTE